MIITISSTEWVDHVIKINCNKIEIPKNIITLGNMSYIVEAEYVDASEGSCHVLIGRYTSIAHRVSFNIFLNHDYKSVANYPLDATIKKMSAKDINDNRKRSNKSRQIIIGNDVWIGADVKIYGGITIGNGAIIAGNTVVTKDVPPYAIVGGNPATIIRYRFRDEIIEKLQRIKWWYWPINKIKKNFELMKNPELFCNVHYKKNNNVLLQGNNFSFELDKLRKFGYKIYYIIADFDAINPLCNEIIKVFKEKHSLLDKKILIVYCNNNEEYNRIEYICSDVDNVYAYYDMNITDMSFLKNIDYFITTREGVCSEYVDYCSLYDVIVLKGLDCDIFY